MNKTVMWVIVALIVIGGAMYFATSKKSSAPATPAVDSSTNQAASATPAANPTAAPQSLKDLVALGGSQKCTFSNEGSQGTFYVSSGKARGDFSSTVAGKSTSTHMIMDGSTSYMWVDGQKQGFRMDASAAASAQAQAQTQANPAAAQAIDANQKMNYSCSAAASDSSMFTLPSGIEFVDMAAMMKAQIPGQ